jgi:tetratricopeptide (TPR) repeat protein
MKKPSLVAVLLLVLLTLGTFWPVVRFDFVHWDDDTYVLNNTRVQAGITAGNVAWAFTTTYFGYYYPLTWLSHMLDCQLYGLWAGGHHATSLAIHLANVLLLFAALAAMTGAVWRSTVVAALFAVHPQHVESVAWIAERKDVLSTGFCLLAIVAYARYAKKPSAAGYAIVLAAFVLGLFAKPMIVTLPFLLLLLDYWPLERATLPPLWKEKLPLFALVPLFGLVTYAAQKTINAVASVDAIPMGQRVANGLISYAGYIVKMFAPLRLTAFYAHPRGGVSYGLAAAAAAALAVLTAALCWFGRRRRYLTVGWLWYLGTLAPVIGIIQVGNQASADRYTYLPFVGLFILLVWGAADAFDGWLLRHPAPAATIAAVVIVAYAARAHAQVYSWKDSATLFSAMVAISPDAAVAHYNLGKVADEQGRTPDAVASYRKAIELEPGRANAWTNLGIDLQKTGDNAGALDAFLRSDQLKPGTAATQFDIGLLRESLGQFPEALAAYDEALRLDPSIAGLHAGLSRVYRRLGRPKDAVAAGVEALKRNPDDVAACVNLGSVCEELGLWAEAQLAFEQATRLNPGDAESWALLALAYQNQTQNDKAMTAYREAIRRKPELSICRYNLGVLALKAADVPAAREQADALRELDAQLAERLESLIQAHGGAGPR